MSLETQSPDPVISLMDSWNIHMRSQDLEQARETRSEVEQKLKGMEDIQLANHHQLLEARYQLLEENYDRAGELLVKLEAAKEELDGLYTYYFHFFKGMAAYGRKDYNEALEHYGVAGEMLEAVTDELEIAEYHYKLAANHYYNRRTSLSINHTRQALDIFWHHDHLKRIADSEVLLGVNCVDIRQYEEAEEKFYYALDYANKIKDNLFKALIYHNLGMLYADQNLSSAAVTWLEKSLELDHVTPHLTVYEIAREKFKLGEIEEADTLVTKGIKLSHEADDDRYVYHFRLLEALYSDKNNDFENVYKEGLSVLESEELWVDVQEYSEDLAQFYRKNKQYKNASDYYNHAIKARKKIFEMEALK